MNAMDLLCTLGPLVQAGLVTRDEDTYVVDARVPA